jgi:Beta-propeller repeat
MLSSPGRSAMQRRALRAVGTTVVGAALLSLLALTTAHAQTDPGVGWVRNYSSGHEPEFAFAYATAVDGFGDVYVTGSSYGSNGLPDYATIKYSSSGDTLWVQRYNGPGDNWDAATELVLDAAGNVYVTGHSYGPDDFDYVTIKYGPAGTQEWVATYDGPARSEDWPNALAVDTSGNVYVTGWSGGAGTFFDYATIKYNASGVQQWAARYNGPGNTKDRARALGVDESGNVYVTGDSGEGSGNFSDYLTVKYNSSGAQQWTARYDNSYDYATDLALDPAGNVDVTGYSLGFGTSYDYATLRYSPLGQQRWVARFHGGLADDLAYDLATDASGNVYVTGETVEPGTGSEYGTVKYDATGAQQWVARYNGPVAYASDRANAVAVDALGNVYVTGESEGSGTETDYATLKYDAQGVQQWLARYNGPGNTFDMAAALAVDASGSVYVTGRSAHVGGSVFTTIKYAEIAPPPPPPAPPQPPPQPPPPPPAPPPPPPPPVRCVVPRAIGLRLVAAKRKIRRRHCSVGRVRRVRSSRVGRIIGQRPRPGTIKRRGYPIVLVVGRA